MKLKAEYIVEGLAGSALCHTPAWQGLKVHFFLTSFPTSRFNLPILPTLILFLFHNPLEAFVATSHFLISHMQATS